MSRKRLISPEFFTHGALYDAEQQAGGLPLRLAFAGLWTACDRRGLFAWRPRELKLKILPYDSCDFEAVLYALAASRFVERYVVDGKEYGRIPSFERWQSFHKNEKPSDVPEPPKAGPESSKLGSDRAVLTTGTVTGTALTTAADAVAGADAPRPSAADSFGELLSEAGLVLADFGEFAGNVEGLIRAARSPLARAQTIAAHLPHRGGTSNHMAVGLACREFAAQNQSEFNARYFAAFVERAEKTLERNTGRRAIKQEARHIDREAIARENADREAAEADRLLSEFQSESPERFAELQRDAERSVKAGGVYRGTVVRGALLSLVRQESQQGAAR